MMATSEDKKQCKVNKISKYKKRSGTSGITGSLYRSHLLGLILSRNLNEETEFVLGCNVDEIGAMNEICFTFNHENKEKSVAVFIKIKYTGHITDDDLTNPKSAFNLYKCYQSHISIKEKFDDNLDALFVGKFNDIEPYFVIYTPHQNKIKNHLADLKEDDQTLTKKVNGIIGNGNNKSISKVKSENLIADVVNSTIELIGNTIATYVTSDVRDRDEITNNMKKILKKYSSFLIPHVIKLNDLDKNNYGKFNESLHENSNSHIQLLKNVLFTEILKKSNVDDKEASANIQLLLETNEYTVDMLTPLVGTVITFDVNSKKLVYMPGVSDCIEKKALDDINVTKYIFDEAFVFAGMKALKYININFDDLGIPQTITKKDIQIEQTMPESFFEEEKQLVDGFLNRLYIYTDQVKENDVSKRLQQEIVKHQAKNKNTSNIFQNKPEAALVDFHHKVQEWMLSMDKPQYLTHICDFMKCNTNVVEPHLSILNYNCIMELQGYLIEFNSKSFNSFSKLDDTQSCLNIVSNNVLLTSIKLMQYLSDQNCMFINFDHVCNLKDIEFDMLIKQVNTATYKKLIVLICDTMNDDSIKTDKLNAIVVNFKENVLIVSDYNLDEYETLYDNITGLEDTENTNELLKYEVTVQGKKDELGKFIDENTLSLIDDRILSKMIKHENIEIGQNLSDSLYNEIKNCFVNRRLRLYNKDDPEYQNECFVSTIMPWTLDKIQFASKFVAIFAEAGMGKSTFLTHISVNTKQINPKMWVVRMNLLNYCEDFVKWEVNGIDVDVVESMHLVCRAALNHREFDKLFTLERESKGDLVLIESKELDPVAALLLKLLIFCFNSGNVLFLLDGFDEICPHYETVVVKFIKSIITKDKVDDKNVSLHTDAQLNQFVAKIEATENQIWITSRPYNDITSTLDAEFDILILNLKPLAADEQYRFYQMYWETQIKVEELNSDQFNNVKAFFEYMNQYRLRSMFFNSRIFALTNNLLLRRMHEAAVHYFRYKIRTLADSNDQLSILDKWISPIEMFTSDDHSGKYEYGVDTKELQLTGILLHMKIFADLFANQIRDTSSPKQWDLGVDTYEFYERFLEYKLMKIRLEEKAGETVHTSACLSEFEDLMAEVTEEHKQLAFYSFFHNSSSYYKEVLPEPQWIKIQSIIERIKRAEEKTGLIDRIQDGVPRFVHLIFAEYYAVEYVAGMLKRSLLSDDEVHLQIDFVVNCLLNGSVGIMRAFNNKLKNDFKLRKALDNEFTMKFVFNVWIEQPVPCDKEDKNKQSCLRRVLSNKFLEIACFLVKSLKYTLNPDNIQKFVDTIGSDFFRLTVEFESLLLHVVDSIRYVDPTMLVKALQNSDIHLGDFPDNESILNSLREKYPGLSILPSPRLGPRFCRLMRSCDYNSIPPLL